MESEGNYVRLHAGTRVHLVRETMASIEGRWGTIGSAASIVAGLSTSIASANCTSGPTANTNW